MTAFALFLGEKAERYIELRHSLGYSFSKQTTFSWSGRTRKCCCAAKGAETVSSPSLRILREH